MENDKTVTETTRKYGWKRDLPDHRDIKHVFSIALTAIPTLVDLRANCPPVYDQGQLGSCTANAIAAAYEFDQMKQKDQAFTPSRLFIYYNERALEHTVPYDSGASIRDSAITIQTSGVCPETMWPYIISEFTQKPLPNCYSTAALHKSLQHRSVTQDLTDIKACLASGFPFVFGFTVYSSFESPQVAATGKMPMPQPHEQMLGGHAVMAVGYNDATQQVIVRNSWGASWGDKGYFYMPYAYITNPSLASDFWTVSQIIS